MTNQGRELPLTGYEIEKIYTIHQLMEHMNPGEPDTQGLLDIGWDWRLLLEADVPTFEVRLSATVEPSEDRDDFITASVVGRFRQTAEEPTVHVIDFARLHGPAILLPYLRQALSSLTSLSFYGSYYLPPINVQSLMADFDPEQTSGAKQLSAIASWDVEHRSQQNATQHEEPDTSAKRRSRKRVSAQSTAE